MSIDMRDVLIGINIVAMLGGAGLILGSVRTEIHHLTQAIVDLREWLKTTSDRLRAVEQDVAVIKRRHDA